jgi:hypothetical protein
VSTACTQGGATPKQKHKLGPEEKNIEVLNFERAAKRRATWHNPPHTRATQHALRPARLEVDSQRALHVAAALQQVRRSGARPVAQAVAQALVHVVRVVRLEEGQHAGGVEAAEEADVKRGDGGVDQEGGRQGGALAGGRRALHGSARRASISETDSWESHETDSWE